MEAASTTSPPQRVVDTDDTVDVEDEVVVGLLQELGNVSDMCDGMVECEFDVVDSGGQENCVLSTVYECSEAPGNEKRSSDAVGSIAELDCYGTWHA